MLRRIAIALIIISFLIPSASFHASNRTLPSQFTYYPSRIVAISDMGVFALLGGCIYYYDDDADLTVHIRDVDVVNGKYEGKLNRDIHPEASYDWREIALDFLDLRDDKLWYVVARMQSDWPEEKFFLRQISLTGELEQEFELPDEPVFSWFFEDRMVFSLLQYVVHPDESLVAAYSLHEIDLSTGTYQSLEEIGFTEQSFASASDALFFQPVSTFSANNQRQQPLYLDLATNDLHPVDLDNVTIIGHFNNHLLYSTSSPPDSSGVKLTICAYSLHDQESRMLDDYYFISSPIVYATEDAFIYIESTYRDSDYQLTLKAFNNAFENYVSQSLDLSFWQFVCVGFDGDRCFFIEKNEVNMESMNGVQMMNNESSEAIAIHAIRLSKLDQGLKELMRHVP